MKKVKLFLDNFIIYGVGGTINKIVPLIMVPIITRLMPDTSYYGISDLVNTVISLGSSIAIMGMYDAMYRMFFEKDDVLYKKQICSTALLFTLFTSIIVSFLLVMFRGIIAKIAFKNADYDYLVYIIALAVLIGSTNSIVSAPTRMQNKRKVFLIMNTLSSLLSYSIAIPLILKKYYITALAIATVLAGVSCEIIFLLMNYKWFSLKLFKKEYLKQLIKIAIPLMPGFLIYWIFNSSDRLMITHILGTGASGIYSVGSKLGHASQLIYTAFAGGWQFYAFSTMKEDTQVISNSRIFEYLGVFSYGSTILIFGAAELIFKLLFSEDYLSGFIASPYLFFAPLLQMLFQVAANQFLIIKKTWPNLVILLSGAIVNIILNLWLIPLLGIEGAAIATLIGYAVSDIVCCIALCRIKLMVISRRFIISTILMVGYILLWRFILINSIILSLLIGGLWCMIFVLLYKKDISILIYDIKSNRIN